MENKKTFVENDLQEFFKKTDTSIDKIVYEECTNYENEAVIVFFKDGRKAVANVTGNDCVMTAYEVLRNIVRM